MNQIPKKRRTYRALTSETRATASMSGMIVPKSPSEPASSERENFIGRAGCGGSVSVIAGSDLAKSGQMIHVWQVNPKTVSQTMPVDIN